MGRPFNRHNTDKADGLRLILSNFDDEFKKWSEELKQEREEARTQV
jgi:hypothetical protein